VIEESTLGDVRLLDDLVYGRAGIALMKNEIFGDIHNPHATLGGLLRATAGKPHAAPRQVGG
jgi:hypothetical protein